MPPSSAPDAIPANPTETVYENPWFSVRRRAPYHWIEQARSGAVLLLQRADQTIALLRHHRLAADTALWEFPRGAANERESLAECAAREGREETGYTVDRDTVRLLGSIYPDAGLIATRVEAYAARTTTLRLNAQQRARNPDAAERAAIQGLMWVPPDHLAALIRQGEIADGFTLAAYAMWAAAQGRR
jgi:ADP-ribose pyrophosphatase